MIEIIENSRYDRDASKILAIKKSKVFSEKKKPSKY